MRSSQGSESSRMKASHELVKQPKEELQIAMSARDTYNF